ncbi:outer membrane protein TOM13-domain-containing protein [Xylaria intraflava]|nr:outer membrane protein TOM13-domain-containing protein [Xylaria intraflava]
MASDERQNPPPRTTWALIRSMAINLALPFINGMMSGFGELFAHEAAFRLGWGGTRVFPPSRQRACPIDPGIESDEETGSATEWHRRFDQLEMMACTAQPRRAILYESM